MIKPTVGRKVWVRGRPQSVSGDQPEDGTITYVHSDTCINVGGRNAVGEPFTITSLYLRQDDVPAPALTWAEWMPYQKGQAAKDAAGETTAL